MHEGTTTDSAKTGLPLRTDGGRMPRGSRNASLADFEPSSQSRRLDRIQAQYGAGPSDLAEKTLERDWSLPCGRCCVVDLETGPDRHAQRLAGRQRVGPDSCLREIRVASVLTFDEDGSGMLLNPSLTTFDMDTHSEAGIIQNVDRAIEGCVKAGTLITFNGRSFDLPVLRARQLRWWLVDACASSRAADAGRHVDVMLELSMAGRGRWPTLVDACASLGLALHGPNQVGPSSFLPAVEKCEVDVAGTAALFLYLLAGHRRSDASLRHGLPALSRELRSLAVGRPHLATLAMSRVLALGDPWGTIR
jgi:hypothetical protein